MSVFRVAFGLRVGDKDDYFEIKGSREGFREYPPGSV